MMTTASEQYKNLEAKYAAVRFISKPVNAKELESKISRVTGK